MTGPYAVRPAVAADAPGLGAMHVQVWREAYAGVMSQGYLDAMDVDASVAKWRAIIAGSRASEPATSTGGAEQGQPAAGADELVVPKVTRVAEHVSTGDVVGFATYGPARDEDAPIAGQLWVINLLAAHHGSGVADQLMAATVGERPAYLWVVEDNLRAQAFYRRHGFAADGGRSVHEATGAQEIRMVR